MSTVAFAGIPPKFLHHILKYTSVLNFIDTEKDDIFFLRDNEYQSAKT